MRRVRRGIFGGPIHPRIGLVRSRALIVIGTVMYVVAWFVPTLFVPAFKIDLPFQGTDLGPLTIPGWEAFRFALGPSALPGIMRCSGSRVR